MRFDRILVTFTAVLTLLEVTSAVRTAQSQPSSNKPGEVPACIATVGELGEKIYDLAKEKNWTEVTEKLTLLKKEADTLRSQVKVAKEAEEQLGAQITALAKSVDAKDRQATMQEANQITLIAASLSEPFHPKVPIEITRLDYYGRELEIWSAAKNVEKLKEVAGALSKTWDKVRPSVKERNRPLKYSQFPRG